MQAYWLPNTLCLVLCCVFLGENNRAEHGIGNFCYLTECKTMKCDANFYKTFKFRVYIPSKFQEQDLIQKFKSSFDLL